ncbi:MAG TPA: porin [Planctomycetota bacterium]|nr:porin [Planctomycetota bacterium]
MNFVWSAVIALGVAGAAYANDDEAKTTPRTYTQAEVEALLDLATRVTKLEEVRQDAEMERLKKMAEKEKQDDQAGLAGRVSALEKKMSSAGQTWDASKMLTFATPDGNFTMKIGGRLFVVYRHIMDWDTQNAADSFVIDTARIQFDGTFFKDFYYRVEFEAKSNDPAGNPAPLRTKDVYMGWQGLGDWFTFQAGQFKQTFSQEETTSSRFIDFAERSIVNRIVPGHVQGVRASGALFEKSFEWYLGYMNGAIARDGDRGSVDGNDEKDLFGRFFITPLKTTDIGFLKTLRLGYDWSWGKRDAGSAAAPANVSSGDLGLPAILTVTPVAGTVFQGRQARQDVNFSWNYGSMNLRAEYIRVKTDLDGANPALISGAHHQTAWYVSSAYVLTGEEKTLENRIKPATNFSPLDGQWGAWELAARWAVINQDNDSGVATSLNQTHTTEYTLGINWWMTPNVVLRIDWEHLIYDRDIATGFNGALKRSEDEIYIRWQIDF